MPHHHCEPPPTTQTLARTEDNELRIRKPLIMVASCGGAGMNALENLNRTGLRGAKKMCINTASRRMNEIDAFEVITLGGNQELEPTHRMETNANSTLSLLEKERIASALEGTDVVFVICGLGGDTGTYVAPKVADIARESGALVVGIACTPFSVEGGRCIIARSGLELLRAHCDTIIILENDRLLELVPNLPIGKAFQAMDQLITESVMGFTEPLTQESLISMHSSDLLGLFKNSGTAALIYGEGSSSEPGRTIDEALKNPLLDFDAGRGQGLMVHIVGGPELTSEKATEITQELVSKLGFTPRVIHSARRRDGHQDRLTITAILTGIDDDRDDDPGEAFSMELTGT